jgi:hypothetical protein
MRPRRRRYSTTVSLADRVRDQIARTPGQTASELSIGLFGRTAEPSRLQFALTLLDLRGGVRRSGAGGRSDPFRYFPTGARDTALG